MNVPGFIQEKVLGKGSYGVVFKAKRTSDQNSYAVKVVNLSGMDLKTLEDSINEIRLMASFKSPYIVSFYEAFCNDNRLCVVTEYAKLGDLSHFIERRKRERRPFHEDDIWRFLIQITEGLKTLHDAGVVHRDIKSANILMCAPDLVKVGDLGISTVLRTSKLAKTQIGTPLYLAPEVWKRRPYDEKADMWSLGVVLYEMMTFRFPFGGKTTQDLAKNILTGRFAPIGGNYSNELQSIVRHLLQLNPQARPSSNQLLSCSYIHKRMHLILNVPTEHANSGPTHLLSTIKVPQRGGLRKMSLPAPKYAVQKDLVKPLSERINCKGGCARRSADFLSTRELQMVADYDMWSPKKAPRPENNDPNTPLTDRSNGKLESLAAPQTDRSHGCWKGDYRKWNVIRQPQILQPPAPRFKRPAPRVYRPA